jgi:hypothetical protein
MAYPVEISAEQNFGEGQLEFQQSLTPPIAAAMDTVA